jgi:hypothetical protein
LEAVIGNALEQLAAQETAAVEKETHGECASDCPGDILPE